MAGVSGRPPGWGRRAAVPRHSTDPERDLSPSMWAALRLAAGDGLSSWGAAAGVLGALKAATLVYRPDPAGPYRPTAAGKRRLGP